MGVCIFTASGPNFDVDGFLQADEELPRILAVLGPAVDDPMMVAPPESLKL